MARKAHLKDGRVLCSICSSPLESMMASCSACNEPLEGEFKAILCPDCKTILPRDTARCHSCGLRFKIVLRQPEASESDSSEDEAFLGRLLKWSEDGMVKTGKPVITPTVMSAESERFIKEEEKAEEEESIKGVVEALESVIESRKKRCALVSSSDLESMEALRAEEKESLEMLEKLVRKAGRLFSELLVKHEAEILEREEEVKSQLEISNKEMEKALEQQERLAEPLTRELKEKKAIIKGLMERQAQLEKENRELTALKEKGHHMDGITKEMAELKKRNEQLEKDSRELSELRKKQEQFERVSRELAELKKVQALRERESIELSILKKRNELMEREKREFAELKKRCEQLEKENRELAALRKAQVHPEKDGVEFTVMKKRQEQLENENRSLSELHREVKDVFGIIDNLLGELSEEEIERFAKSKEYKRYEAILQRIST